MSSGSYAKLVCCILLIVIITAITVSAVITPKSTLKNNDSLNKSKITLQLKNITLNNSSQVNVTPSVNLSASPSRTQRGVVKSSTSSTTSVPTSDKTLSSTESKGITNTPTSTQAGQGGSGTNKLAQLPPNQPSVTQTQSSTQTSDASLSSGNGVYNSFGNPINSGKLGQILGQAAQNQPVVTPPLPGQGSGGSTTIATTASGGSGLSILNPISGGSSFFGGISPRSYGSF